MLTTRELLKSILEVFDPDSCILCSAKIRWDVVLIEDSLEDIIVESSEVCVNKGGLIVAGQSSILIKYTIVHVD